MVSFSNETKHIIKGDYMSYDSSGTVKQSGETYSEYYYSRAIYYNKQLDEVISLLDSYYQQLSAKLTEATSLLDETSNLYIGISDYVSLIKIAFSNCVDEIERMKDISIGRAKVKDAEVNANKFGGEDNG